MVEKTVLVVVGVLIAGAAHLQPEEMPLEPFRSAQVKGFCGLLCRLFNCILAAGVVIGDASEASQTKEVDALILSIGYCEPYSARVGAAIDLRGFYAGDRRDCRGSRDRPCVNRGDSCGGNWNFAHESPVSVRTAILQRTVSAAADLLDSSTGDRGPSNNSSRSSTPGDSSRV